MLRRQSYWYEGNRHPDCQVEQKDLPGLGPADTGSLVVPELVCLLTHKWYPLGLMVFSYSLALVVVKGRFSQNSSLLGRGWG